MFDNALRDLAEHAAQLALEVANSCFASVVANNRQDCFVVERDGNIPQSELFNQPRDDVAFGDLEFVVVEVR